MSAGVALVSLGVWLYLILARGGYWRAKSEDAVVPGALPDIHVIIPARNETEVLKDTLPTLLGRDYPVRVTLVDDRSEDGTAEEAARIAASLQASDRLTVIRSRPMPSGWKGKVWAMQCGLDAIAASCAVPRYVLFTDADIAYDKGALAQLVGRAEAQGYVLTSLMVKLRCRSAAEKFLIPAFVYFFQMLYPFRWVNDPRRAIAAAAGGCMLVRYDALQQAGGMTPIRGALIDDCAFGQMMKRHGRIRLGLTQQVHSVRAYPRLGDIRAMVARTAYDQLDYSLLNLLGSVLGMMLTYIAPVGFALFASGPAQLCGLLAWALMTLSFLPILRFYRLSPLLSLTLPLVVAAYMAFTLDSAGQYYRGKGGMWKGRVQAGAASA